jgi:hypothetical protein
MKKIILLILLVAAVRGSASEPSPDYYRQFVSCENIGGEGFYWIDTTSGDLWALYPPAMEWTYLGSPRGANSGRKGIYQLLSDRKGGVYVLNSETGEGWWTDGSKWKIIGRLTRLNNRTEQ